MKTNVIFFDKKVARPGQPWTERLWVYDLRTNKHFTLKQNPLRRADLDEFVAAYTATERVESERWKPFTYDEIVARDKANLDITWLKDDSLEDLDSTTYPRRTPSLARSSRTSRPLWLSSKRWQRRWRNSCAATTSTRPRDRQRPDLSFRGA